MFAAVRARLARNVDLLVAIAVGDGAAQARTDLFECIEALGQLQTLLVPERDRRRRLEFEIFDLRSALSLAAPELFQAPACPRLTRSLREQMNGT
jgi:DNA invertase Pin-like site-specific DNA recombinase